MTCNKYFVHGLERPGSGWMCTTWATSRRSPGMVLTVNPGVYLPHEALGIRIEDDVLVTAEGHEVLSAAAPRRPEEVEAVMHQEQAALDVGPASPQIGSDKKLLDAPASSGRT